MTDKKTDFIKIRVWIFVDPSKHYVYKDGKIYGNPQYIEVFYDADAKFREPIMGFINDEIGLHNWAITFKQFDTNVFESDIYCENEEQHHKIVEIIMDKIKGVEFRLFMRKGTIDDYIGLR